MTSPQRRRAWLLPALLAATAALVVAFVIGPQLLLADRCPTTCEPQAVGAALAPALAGFLQQGGAALPGDLAGLVSLWSWWHATKVVVCALLVVVCALLSVQVWRRQGSSGQRAEGWWTLAGVGTTATVPVAAGLLALNVQATAVPLVALLPLLPARGTAPGAAEAAAEQVRALVAASAATSGTGPLSVLVEQVVRYEGTMAAVAGVAAVIAAARAVQALRRRRRCTSSQQRARVRWTAVAAVAVAAVLLFGAAGTAGVMAALDPVDSLRGLVGWDEPLLDPTSVGHSPSPLHRTRATAVPGLFDQLGPVGPLPSSRHGHVTTA